MIMLIKVCRCRRGKTLIIIIVITLHTEVTIDKRLCASIEHSINIGLIPSRLLYGLEFAVKIIQPLANIAL